jgi:hypothetical protein
MPQPALIGGPGVEAPGRLAQRALQLGLGDRWGDGDGHRLANLVLQRKMCKPLASTTARVGSSSGGVGLSLLPMPGQELIQLGSRVIIDPAEYIGEPSLRIDVLKLGGLDQGEHRNGTFPTPIGAGGARIGRRRAEGGGKDGEAPLEAELHRLKAETATELSIAAQG